MIKSKASYLEKFLKIYVYPKYWMIIIVVICILLSSGATVVFTKMIGPAVDNIFLYKNKDVLYSTSYIFFLLFLLRGLMDFAERFYLTKLGLIIIRELQDECFMHLIRYDIETFKERSIGDITSRLTSDVTQLNQNFLENILKVGKDAVTLVCLCVLMFIQDYVLATISIIMFALCGFPTVKIGRRVKQLTHISFTQVGGLTSFLTQVMQSIKIIKSYCTEEHEVENSRKIVDSMCRVNMKSTVAKGYLYPIIEGLAGIAICCTFIIGGGAVIRGESTPGVLMQFIAAFAFAYKPVKNISNLNSMIQSGIAAAERVFSVMEITPKIIDKPDSITLNDVKGNIKFENVHFSYDGNKDIIDGISFEIKKGEKVAIVGSTGAGKSTIVNLLLRFYELNSGKILIDDNDITSLTLKSLRSSIALVAQDVVLFNNTIKYNISYGSFDATDKEVKEASEIVGVYDYINSLNDSFDYVVGDRGNNLSGGQKQKISIARAVLKNAPILIFDEATSSLDQTSEKDVKLALDKLSAGKTTIIIAHRLSTIIDADKIMVLNKGRIVEVGNHYELLNKKGIYASLYSQDSSVNCTN